MKEVTKAYHFHILSILFKHNNIELFNTGKYICTTSGIVNVNNEFV